MRGSNGILIAMELLSERKRRDPPENRVELSLRRRLVVAGVHASSIAELVDMSLAEVCGQFARRAISGFGAEQKAVLGRRHPSLYDCLRLAHQWNGQW